MAARAAASVVLPEDVGPARAMRRGWGVGCGCRDGGGIDSSCRVEGGWVRRGGGGAPSGGEGIMVDYVVAVCFCIGTSICWWMKRKRELRSRGVGEAMTSAQLGFDQNDQGRVLIFYLQRKKS